MYDLTLPTLKALKNPKFKKMIAQNNYYESNHNELVEIIKPPEKESASVSPKGDKDSRKVILTMPVSQREKIM